jgi:16S rRNA (cytidine1402-2'-O)-methyltransferase
MSKLGSVYLIPNTLGGENISDVLPSVNLQKMEEISYFVVETLKVARRFLKKCGYTKDFSDVTFFELNKRTHPSDIQRFLKPLKEGEHLGVISDAGCPGVADPGAALVALAHQMGARIKPLVGPSSILLTLMASGFNGQSFAFHGYLPKERKDRVRHLLYFEQTVQKTGATQLFMDTPFRNNNVLEDLMVSLKPDTLLCIGSNLTMENERTTTMTIKEWKTKSIDIHKQPAMFAIGKFED